jgi:hypothetical protein
LIRIVFFFFVYLEIDHLELITLNTELVRLIECWRVILIELSSGIRAGSIMVQETRSGVPAEVFHETLQSFQQQLDDHTTGMGSIGARMDRLESSFAAL